jgi:hypothetical protein
VRLAAAFDDCKLNVIVDKQTTLQRLKKFIEEASGEILIRQDFAHLGSARQLSRALAILQNEEFITRAGQGVYLRSHELPVQTILSAVRRRLGLRTKRLITVSGTTIALGETSAPLNRQSLLDAKKLASAVRVIQNCTVDQIRRKSLANIKRWNDKGTWVSAHDEWRLLMEQGSDQEVLAVMTGTDERSNRLRQSAPYVGLVDPVSINTVKRNSFSR